MSRSGWMSEAGEKIDRKKIKSSLVWRGKHEYCLREHLHWWYYYIHFSVLAAPFLDETINFSRHTIIAVEIVPVTLRDFELQIFTNFESLNNQFNIHFFQFFYFPKCLSIPTKKDSFVVDDIIWLFHAWIFLLLPHPLRPRLVVVLLIYSIQTSREELI